MGDWWDEALVPLETSYHVERKEGAERGNVPKYPDPTKRTYEIRNSIPLFMLIVAVLATQQSISAAVDFLTIELGRS